jgi:hypothetical protein
MPETSILSIDRAAKDGKFCKEAPLAMNAYCYLPTAWFSRLITNAQLLFEWPCRDTAIQNDKLHTRVGEILPLSDARMAHEMLAGRKHRPSKIVLVPAA